MFHRKQTIEKKPEENIAEIIRSTYYLFQHIRSQLTLSVDRPILPVVLEWRQEFAWQRKLE